VVVPSLIGVGLVAALVTSLMALTVPLSERAGASLTATSADGAALAATPPMGWNDWARFGCRADTPHPGDVGPSEQLILTQAQALVTTGLAAKGYNIVTTDGCWMASARDSSGNLVANPTTFPDGMAYIGSKLHAMGLKFGIYEDAGTMTCGGYPGSWGHYQQDANLFASWGVDFLKFDGCFVPAVPGETSAQAYQQSYAAMSHAIRNSGRDLVFSESAPAYFHLTSDWYTILSWVDQYGQLWRDGPDVAMHETLVTSRWQSVLTNYGYNNTLVRYAGPGGWNDPDLLIAGDTGLTNDESRSQVALWAMMAAPMIVSSDLTSLSADAIGILGNTDVIAVDQDPFGQQGSVVSQTGVVDVLAKPLANGDHAVAILNRSSTAVTGTTTTSDLGLVGGHGCAFSMKDLWSGHVVTTTGLIQATIPAHGTAIFRISATGPCRSSRPVGEIRADVGACVEDHGSPSASNNPAVVSTCNGAPNQRWTIPGDGSVRTLGKCLEIAGGSGAAASPVDVNACIHSPVQQWQYRRDGSLRNPSSGLCLADPNDSATAGTQLQVATCSSNLREQTWSVPAPVLRQVVGVAGKCVAAARGFASSGNPAVVSDCSGALNQLWNLQSDGTVHLAGNCLDIAGGAATGGASIDVTPCTGSSAQQWQYQPNDTLGNPGSGLCLDDPNASTVNGTQLRVWQCGPTQTGETWYLPSPAT
jgi:alpha-galactosidase